MSKKRIVSAASIVLFFSFFACQDEGPVRPPQEPIRGTVEGVVTAENALLEGVLVRLSGNSSQTAQTGAAGTFRFENLPEGAYLVELTTYPEDVEFGSTALGTKISPGSRSPKVEFRGAKKRNATIAGTVTAEGVGMEGIVISLSGSESRSTTTDPQGQFEFTQLAQGKYTVVLSGFDPAVYSFPTPEQNVNAKNGKVVTANFSGSLVPQIPDAPTDLAVTGTASATIDLTWSDASDNETGFRLQRKQGTGGTWAQISTPPANATSFQDSGLNPATAYVYRIQACNDQGCSSFSNEATGVTVDLAPDAPTDLTVTGTASATIDLTWSDASDNETGFRLQRKQGTGGTWAQISTPPATATSFQDSGLNPATAYVYRIQACNDQGCSSFSNEATGVTVDLAPDAPTDLTVTGTASATIDLTWSDASDNETGFRLQRKQGTGGTWAQISTPPATATSFQDSGLSPATAYVYRIQACNDQGCSSFSNEATGVTVDLAPDAPTDLTVTGTASATIDLTWSDASDNETGFRLQRKQGTGGTWAQISTPPATATSFQDSGLSPATAYVYRIQACNDQGCSSFSNEATGVTVDLAPDAPTDLTVTGTASATIDLTWSDASDNETGFRLQRKQGTGGTWAQISTPPANATSFQDSGLSPATAYVYRIQACNDQGCSSFSNEATGVTAGTGGPNLTISDLYITQSTQTLPGTVPLVADKPGFLRVFSLASEANGFQPDVRVRFFQGGSLVHTEVLTAPGSSVPLAVDEGTLSASWNMDVPASLIQPGLAVLAEVDPTDVVAESDESDNAFPASGSPAVQDVRTPPPFNVTFIPVRQSVNGLLGNVTSGNAGQFMDVTMRMLPIVQADVEIHVEYVTDAPLLDRNNDSGAWGTILSEISSLKVVEGSSRYYYGVVKTDYNSGVAGMGYYNWAAAIGWDRLPSASGVAAHEWGHNWNRRHAPGCGAGSPDSSFPYADGKIGVWGLDVGPEAVKSPATHYDFMSYCGPDWISDYNYNAILDYRAAQDPLPSPGSPEPSLIVWGRVERGQIIVEPAFEVTTSPLLPSGSGEYILEGLDLSGQPVFSQDFQVMPVPDSETEDGHFAFAIPLRSFDRARLSNLRVSGGGRSPGTMERRMGPEMVGTPSPEVSFPVGGEMEIVWDDTFLPMALVRDPATGQVLSFARGGRVRLPVTTSEVEIVFSDGLRSTETVRRSVR